MHRVINGLAFRFDNVDKQEQGRIQRQFNAQMDYIKELLNWFPP